MSYEPRGKVKAALDAMRADPERIWSAPELAAVMGIAAAAVPAYLDTMIKHDMVFRRVEGGRSQYALRAFEQPCVSAMTGPTTATGWRPPKMECTRPGAGAAAQKVQGESEPAGDAGATPPETAAPDLPTCTGSQTDPECLAVHPQAAPLVADASIQEGARAEPEPDPVTWSMWEDGDLDLFGLQELEGGGHRLPAEALARLRRFVAWMPA